MFHFVHPASYGYGNQLPSRAQHYYGHYPQQRRPVSYHAAVPTFGSDLAALTAENDRLEARIAALEERARYEDALAREHKRRELATKRLAQLEARQAQRALPSTTLRINPQEPVNAYYRQACEQGGPALARRGACRRRSVPQATETVDEVVNFLNAIFGGQEQPQRQAPATKPTTKLTKPSTEVKEDPYHLAELLQRREEFLSLFTDKPVKDSSSPVASGSNVKLSDSSSEESVPAGTLHARSIASATLSSLSNQFTSLKSSFIIPAAPPAGFEFKKPSNDSSSPSLAFNPTNAPILEFEQQLTKLLSKADEVDSAGSEAVRDQRKALVKQVGEELEKLEQWKAEVWASQSSPASRPIELQEVQGKGKGKAPSVSIEDEEDEDDNRTVRILPPSTSAPSSPSSLAHHSALFSELPVLDHIYPSPPSFTNTDNEEVVGYDVTFDAPAPTPVPAEATSDVENGVADKQAEIAPSIDAHATVETTEPTLDTVEPASPMAEAQPTATQPETADDVAPVVPTEGPSDPFVDTEVDDAASSSSSSDYGDTTDSVLLTTAKDGSILVTETEETVSSGDEYEVL